MSSALLIFLARVLLLLLLYLFLFFVVRALRRDLRAATRRVPAPSGGPPLIAATGTPIANTLGLEVVEAGQSALPPGERFALRDPLLIGRAAMNDITIEDDWVSAQHVRLHRQNGAWLAEDLGSTNGTRINGRPLKGAVRLHSGDVLDLGRVKLRLVEQT